MGSEACSTVLAPGRCCPWHGKRGSFALGSCDLCLVSLSLYHVKQATLKIRREQKRHLWYICSPAHPTNHTNNRTLISLCSKTTLRATAEKKTPNLSSTFNSNLCIYNLRALLLEFLIFRNGAMGVENLQLGWNMRAVCLAARAAAGSAQWAPFSPLLCLWPAQVSAQPSTGRGMGTVSANTTYPLEHGSCRSIQGGLVFAQSFFHVQENMHTYTSPY